MRSIVRRGGGSTPSLRNSQAIASAPTCAHGFATSRSRTASTSASVSAGVREGRPRRAALRPRRPFLVASALLAPHPLRDPLARAAQRVRDLGRRLARKPPPDRLPTQLRLRLRQHHPAPLSARKQRASAPARTARGKRNPGGLEQAAVNETLAAR